MSSDTSTKKMGLVGLTVLVAVNMMGSGIIMLRASFSSWCNLNAILGSYSIRCNVYCLHIR